MIEPIAKSDPAEKIAGALGCAAVAAELEGHLDVFERGQCGDELEALKYEPDFLAPKTRPLVFIHRGEVRVVEEHFAVRWGIETSEQAEQGRLAAARWTDDCHERALRNRERHVPKDCEPILAAAIFLG